MKRSTAEADFGLSEQPEWQAQFDDPLSHLSRARQMG
jgi:hypothetical protein